MKKLYNSIHFLINSIFTLGFKNGVEYWNIYRKSLNDPKIIDNWIIRLRANAAVTRDDKKRDSYINFAKDLEATRLKFFGKPVGE